MFDEFGNRMKGYENKARIYLEPKTPVIIRIDGKYITSGKQLQILYELNKPFTSMAYISVVGRELMFDHPEWFVLCSNMASNVEIYARMDGCAQVNFTFNDFTNKID